MAIKAPDYLTSEKEENTTPIETAPVDEKSIVEIAKEIPSAVYKAATGEGVPIEFPDIPEATDIQDIGFFESIIPNAKLMMARDDVGKAEIIKSSFGNDPRFGGVFSDKHNNPMVVWNEEPYYINKPGFSGQDFGTFIGEIAKYAPASKIVSGGKNIAQISGRGIATYPATELASEAVESKLTPETTKAKKRDYSDIAENVGINTGINVGVDLAVPAVIKPAYRAVRRGMQAGSEALGKAAQRLPRYADKVAAGASETIRPAPVEEIVSKSKYPLTVGQRGAEAPLRGPEERVTPQLQAEETIRRSPGSSTVEDASIIRGFDALQLAEVRADARALQNEFGSGNTQEIGSFGVLDDAATQIQTIASTRASDLKRQAGESFDVVEKSIDQPELTPKGLAEIARGVKKTIKAEFGSAMLNVLPSTKLYLKKMDSLIKIGENPRAKPVSLNRIKDFQEALNVEITKSMGMTGIPQEARGLMIIKNNLSDAFNSAIETGLMTGDKAVLEQLAKSRSLYTQFMGLTGKQTGKDKTVNTANKILQMITNPISRDPSSGYTSRQVVNTLFGHGKFTPDQTLPIVINKLKKVLPEEESKEIIALLKDGVLEKAFSGNGKGGVTRANIVNNFKEVFVDNKDVVNSLFSPEEIARIAKFREDVLPTLWAEIKLNPSGTAPMMLAAMARSKILQFVKLVPIIGKEAAEGIEGIGSGDVALDAIRQYVARSSKPLLTIPISASGRLAAETPEVNSSTIFNLTSEMSPEAKRKIVASATQ
tara:strand:+ start:1130 stop:3430 length:2301 start_codon:yes stop_codon:yes gene_type:complete